MTPKDKASYPKLRKKSSKNDNLFSTLTIFIDKKEEIEEKISKFINGEFLMALKHFLLASSLVMTAVSAGASSSDSDEEFAELNATLRAIRRVEGEEVKVGLKEMRLGEEKRAVGAERSRVASTARKVDAESRAVDAAARNLSYRAGMESQREMAESWREQQFAIGASMTTMALDAKAADLARREAALRKGETDLKAREKAEHDRKEAERRKKLAAQNVETRARLEHEKKEHRVAMGHVDEVLAASKAASAASKAKDVEFEAQMRALGIKW